MKFNLLAVFGLCTLFLLSGCGDDDGGGKNSVKVDGESFRVVAPSLMGVSIDGEGHASITFSNGNMSRTRTLIIDFEYSPDEPVSGSYSYPQNGTDRLLDEWLTSYTVFEEEDMYDTHLSSGNVDVTHNGGKNYTVTMDLLMEDGTEFTGTYRGDFVTQFQNN